MKPSSARRAALWASGVPARRVAEGLGITAESLRVWRRQLGGADVVPAIPVDGNCRQGRRLRAQLQSVTNQREIQRKAVGIFAGPNGSVSP